VTSSSSRAAAQAGSSPVTPTPLVSIEVPADHRYLNIVSACLRALLERVDDLTDRETVTYNMELAVQEACTNIVDHAYDGQHEAHILVHMSLASNPGRVTVDLYDSGRPFDQSEVEETDLDEPHIHGYGLFLMRALADDVQYERAEDRNHWKLSKNL
jgi:serine/threonine-protein kinase RsbW